MILSIFFSVSTLSTSAYNSTSLCLISQEHTDYSRNARPRESKLIGAVLGTRCAPWASLLSSLDVQSSLKDKCGRKCNSKLQASEGGAELTICELWNLSPARDPKSRGSEGLRRWKTSGCSGFSVCTCVQSIRCVLCEPSHRGHQLPALSPGTRPCEEAEYPASAGKSLAE